MIKSTISALILLLTLALTQRGFAEEGDGISGLWLGTYTYKDDSYKPSRFALVLKKEDLAFSGKVLENNSFGDETAAYLSADVMGALDEDGHIHFYHRYDGTGGQHHMVVYDGTLNEKKTVITGTWAISDDWSGTFSMKLIEAYHRDVDPPADAAAEPAVEAGGAAAPAAATPAPAAAPSAQKF